jgi:hypothetical protein
MLNRAVQNVKGRKLARPSASAASTSWRRPGGRDVKPAWELMQHGQVSGDARIRATQERPAACHYAMAHPEDGTLVPACVQHCVLDPQENRELRTLLPLPQTSSHNASRRADRARLPGGSGAAR